MRGDATGANTAASPSITSTTLSTTTPTTAGTVNSYAHTVDAANRIYVVNQGTTTNGNLILGTIDAGNELNTTMTITKATTTLDGNSSATVVDVNSSAVALINGDENGVTKNTVFKLSSSAAKPNTTAGGGYSMATYNVVATDEFGKSSTAGEHNVSFVYNARPVASLGYGQIDVNMASGQGIDNISAGGTTLTTTNAAIVGALTVVDEDDFDEASNRSTASVVSIYGIGVGNSTANALTDLTIGANDNHSNSLGIVSLFNASVGNSSATVINFSANSTTGSLATMTLANNGSNTYTATFANGTGVISGSADNMTTNTYVAVRFNIKDEYDANTTKDLYIKFTK